MQAAHMQLIKFNQSAAIIPSVLRAHISGMHIRIHRLCIKGRMQRIYKLNLVVWLSTCKLASCCCIQTGVEMANSRLYI